MSWASTIIERGRAVGPIPIYRSPEWEALPPNSPQAVAACVAAAECWHDYTDPATVRRDLELELTANTQLERDQEARDFAELARGVRALSSVPTQVELAARRSVVAA